MNPAFLDFEQPIAELEAKIAELRHASQGNAFNIDAEIAQLKEKLKAKTEQIFSGLTAWQVSQLARHPLRPYTLDYAAAMFDEFHELAGDRAFADDEDFWRFFVKRYAGGPSLPPESARYAAAGRALRASTLPLATARTTVPAGAL